MAPPVPESLSGLSSASLSDNPGLTSGNNTPQTSHTDVFPEARVTTPGTEDQSDVSSVDARLVADAGVDELEDEDEDVDPILHHIAHVQLEQPGSAQFRARPAPPTTFIEGVGPRLTKAAALRQGLEWDDPRDTRRALGSEVPVDFDNVPGHKRSGLALVSDFEALYARRDPGVCIKRSWCGRSRACRAAELVYASVHPLQLDECEHLAAHSCYSNENRRKRKLYHCNCHCGGLHHPGHSAPKPNLV